MGNDETFISKYLDRHYKVTLFGVTSFIIVDLETDKHYYLPQFEKDIFEVIFGEYIMSNGVSSLVFLDRWFTEKKRQMAARLMDYVMAMDLRRGSITLFDELNRVFANDKEYDREFINIMFNEYYSQKVTLAATKKFLKGLKIKLGPKDWLITWNRRKVTPETILDFFPSETIFQQALIRRMFEVWYTEARLNGTEKEMNIY